LFFSRNSSICIRPLLALPDLVVIMLIVKEDDLFLTFL
jgi:hypothetical protein